MKPRFQKKAKAILREYQLYLMFLPVFAVLLVFNYWPMYGAQIAFRQFVPTKGIWGSSWVGLQNFTKFISNPFFGEILRNTLVISVYYLFASFPIPVLFAILLNYQRNLRYKKIVQTVSFAPHFISIVVVAGMIRLFTSPTSGLLNNVLRMLDKEPVHFMALPAYYPHIYVWSGIWQSFGWASIVYIGALSAVSPELHEAAIVDGASILKRIWHVDLPGIRPTVITMLILSTGNLLNVGFEKSYLLQNPLNLSVSEVISTYVYKQGIIKAQFSYSTAVGLFNSVINFMILCVVNYIAAKVNDTSVF